MTGSLNKVILVGEIDGEIEIKENSFGKRVAKFFIRTFSSWRDKDGFEKDSIERYRVVIFNERIVSNIENLTHGAKISVEGSVQHSKWQDNNGQEHYTVEVVLSQYRGEITTLNRDNTFSIQSLNRVMLIGNLGADPTIRLSKAGKKIASISVATSDKYKKNNGEVNEKTEWHDVVVFNEHISQVAERYLSKGSKIYVEGYLRNKIWQDKIGNEHNGIEVVVSNITGDLKILSSKNSRQNDDDSGSSRFSNNSQNDSSGGDFFDKEGDDIPAF